MTSSLSRSFLARFLCGIVLTPADAAVTRSTTSLRPSVHNEKNQSKDLKGGYVLLSDHFFYFGDQPIVLPETLLEIVLQGQSHQLYANAQNVDAFVAWINSLGYPPSAPIGKPQWWSKRNFQASCDACATGRRQEAEADLAVLDSPRNNPC
jgi:hypothetical protein